MNVTAGIRTLLKSAVTAWGDNRPVVVAAGRNFSIEEEIASWIGSPSQIISWGSSLYEFAYGDFLSSKNHHTLRIMPEVKQRLEFLPQPSYPIETAAMLTLSQHIRDAVVSEQAEIALRTQWIDLKTRAHNYVMNRPLKLTEFWSHEDWPKSPSLHHQPPAYVYVPQMVSKATEEVFYCEQWKPNLAAEFDEKVLRVCTSAHPFFVASPVEIASLNDRLIGRLMNGTTSTWVYSSHGEAVVLRDDPSLIARWDKFYYTDIDKPLTIELHEVTAGIYRLHRELYAAQRPTATRKAVGGSYLLTVNGKIVGGWVVRLGVSAEIRVDVADVFSIDGDSAWRLTYHAIFSREARLRYESTFSTRVEIVVANNMLHVYARHGQTELEMIKEEWRAKYQSDARRNGELSRAAQ